MIKSVTVINDQNEQLELVLTEPWSTGLIVESITGIGPEKANINMTELATSDGSIFSSARLPSRNIVMKFRLMEVPDVETTRHLTYKFFPLKKEVTLIFETDYRVIAIDGYIESNEPDIFQKQETAQISIICQDPYFYADNADYILNGIQKSFSFPFSNESLDAPLINLGEIIYETGTTLVYEGDVESGVLIHMHASDNVQNFWIRNVATGVSMEFDTSKIAQITGDGNDDVIAADDIYISTMSTNKYVRLFRNGVWYNILPTLPKMSDWIILQKGPNVFRYGADAGAANVEITMQSYVLYAGV